MATNLSIKATKRTIRGKKCKTLRVDGLLPAVVYGKGDNHVITLKSNEFLKLYRKVGMNHVFDIDIEGKSVSVLIHQYTEHPVSDEFTHIDFLEIDITKPVHTMVPLHFIGESPAVKLGAVLFTQLHELEVKCLPKDIPDHLDVDISTLGEIGHSIHVDSVVTPSGVELTLDVDNMIISAQKTRLSVESDEENTNESEENENKEEGEKENTDN